MFLHEGLGDWVIKLVLRGVIVHKPLEEDSSQLVEWVHVQYIVVQSFTERSTQIHPAKGQSLHETEKGNFVCMKMIPLAIYSMLSIAVSTGHKRQERVKSMVSVCACMFVCLHSFACAMMYMCSTSAFYGL